MLFFMVVIHWNMSVNSAGQSGNIVLTFQPQKEITMIEQEVGSQYKSSIYTTTTVC